MITLRSRHKQCHFNRAKSPLYLVKLKMAQNGRLFTALRSVEVIVPNFRRKSFSVPFVSFPVVRKFFQQSSCRKYFTFVWVFIRNLSSNSIWLILACELKLNCPDL